MLLKECEGLLYRSFLPRSEVVSREQTVGFGCVRDPFGNNYLQDLP
jgi:hypothetical protein